MGTPQLANLVCIDILAYFDWAPPWGDWGTGGPGDGGTGGLGDGETWRRGDGVVWAKSQLQTITFGFINQWLGYLPIEDFQPSRG
uniref:Uncharacterized protein n=1 Tax=Planktothricoides sp. SpSt-374 TaxID=2282167 RepID=A0A7C3VGK3_9CYAN